MKTSASRNSILKETQDVIPSSTPPLKSKTNTPRSKTSKENAPPQSAPDPNSPNIKSPLPPRPPLKRKLSAESATSDNSALAPNSSDSGVKVVIRIRPPSRDEEEGGNAIQNITEDSLTISGQTFTFDSVADVHSKQIDIFQHVGAPLVENCLSGFNSSVFAYGQTGSGKTYTIWGSCSAHLDEDQQGLAPRVFQRLFERIEEEQVKHADGQLIYMCHCSFLEIYNEQITDLLDPTHKNLQIREDVRTGVYIENLREECVSSMNHVSQLLMKGLSNRRTSATYLNAESSRSHSVFTCVVESRIKSLTDGVMQIKTSKINFVDLAGSERQKQTGAVGERLKEAGNINRSLSQLGNLINILAEVSHGKQRHIPYRDSKLTFLLQESLGGNAKLAMICAISPSQSCKSETLSTLRFAQRAKSIKNRAIVNEELQDDVNVLREVIRQLKDELQRIKSNTNQPNENETYGNGWNARRSLNLLRFSLNRPAVLPHVDDDSDEEMEIMDTNKEVHSITEATPAGSPEPGCEDSDVKMNDEASDAAVGIISESGCGMTDQHMESSEEKPGDTLPEHDANCCGDATVVDFRVTPAPSISPSLRTGKGLWTSLPITPSECAPGHDMPLLRPSKCKCFKYLSGAKSCATSNDDLAARIHHGLEIIHSQCLNPSTRKSAFRFTCTDAEIKAIIPVVKVDVGVQAALGDHESSDMDEFGSLCGNCKSMKSQKDLNTENGDVCRSMQLALEDESSKTQVPKEVEKVLAGAIRREMSLEELCSKQSSEIMHLNRLIQQYKHERECNEIIRQLRDDKIARLESLIDGILPTEDFMEEEMRNLAHEHKILVEKYENHPELMRTKIELKRAQDEIEKYQNFFDFGERDVLLEEIQDLRNQLQIYLDLPLRQSRREALPPFLQPASLCEQLDAPGSTCSIDNMPHQERIQWTEMESKWNSLVDELRAEVEASRSIAQKQMDELDMEKKCSEELKEAMTMAMQGHARMLEQYADLEEKHILLLARHRKFQDGVHDVKKAAAKAGVRGAASKFINALAAEISSLKVEREKERRYLRDENKGLQEQLRDTAEAVQAAGELLVRLKETEEALAAEQKRVRVAEQETEDAYRELDKLNKLLAAHHAHEEASYGGEESKEAAAWQQEFAPSYGMEEEPPIWFSGYDRCNV